MSEHRARMTARRVHEELKGKMDPIQIFVIAALAEDLSETRKEIVMVAQQVDTLASLMNSFVHVQADMAEKLKKARLDDLDDVTPYVQAVDPRLEDK